VVKRTLIAVVGALSFALAGCSTIGGALLSGALSDDKPAVAVGDKVLVQANNALADAADAYAVTAQAAAAVIRTDTPHLSDDQVRMIGVLNNQAHSLLTKADQGLTVAERAAGLTLVVTQLRSIIGRSN
jgi:hypothetical protein